jgi:hypothetical protein
MKKGEVHKVRLTDEQSKLVSSFPESGMGYHVVNVKTSDGRTFNKKPVVNSKYLMMDGSEDVDVNSIKSISLHETTNNNKKMEENKDKLDVQAERMLKLVKSFDEKGEILKEEKEVIADEKKVIEEAGRLRELARVDEWISNNQFAGTPPVAGFGQTVNTFLPSPMNNAKYNPNYTYLQPAEALNLAIRRTLESGAPVNNIGFYEEVNWNLNNMGFDSKLPLDIKNAIVKMSKDSL